MLDRWLYAASQSRFTLRTLDRRWMHLLMQVPPEIRFFPVVKRLTYLYVGNFCVVAIPIFFACSFLYGAVMTKAEWVFPCILAASLVTPLFYFVLRHFYTLLAIRIAQQNIQQLSLYVIPTSGGGATSPVAYAVSIKHAGSSRR